VERSVNRRATEDEESPLLRFATRKRVVRTLQRNSQCGEELPSKDYFKETEETWCGVICNVEISNSVNSYS
jgi:hypothetical protein